MEKLKTDAPKGAQYKPEANSYSSEEWEAAKAKLASTIARSIDAVRHGDTTNLWLLIASLNDPRQGFSSTYWITGNELTENERRQIGKTVCRKKRFTLWEAKCIRNGDKSFIYHLWRQLILLA